MTEPVFKKGKAYLDHCWLCHESKAAIKYSQSMRDPIYCGIIDYCGECVQEFDHHVFVVSEKRYQADLSAEEETYKDMGDMADWMAQII